MSDYLGSAQRRRLLRASGAGLFGPVGLGLFGGIRVSTAAPLAGAVPEVDRLVVTVVTDSYHHAFEPTRTIGDMQVRRFAFALSKAPPSKALQNEWGLALHLETQRGADTRRTLVDFGYTAGTLLNNLALLNIDAGDIDALVLSHGHYDHFGGLVGFLEANGSRLRDGLPFYLGGEECFCTREAGVGDAAGNFGALDRRAIANARLDVRFAERPTIVADHAFTTGWVPAESFEKVLAPTRMTIGQQDGVGCDPTKMPAGKREVAKIPDDFQHEQATCVHVRGKGLVVVTSCGHRGVVNSVRTAMKVSGIDKVHAVLGGFHLAPHSPDYLSETVASLKALSPDFVIPMHCSGENFIAVAQRELGPKAVRSSTGTRFVFGA